MRVTLGAGCTPRVYRARVSTRYWPLGAGRIETSGFGVRDGGFHYGQDFGRDGGSAGMPVYAAQAGTVIYAGSALGFGGPDPAGWIVIDHPTEAGSGTTVYGHIVREVGPGVRVAAGQRIGHINPDSRTNGGVAPHLHFEVHRAVWSAPGPDRLDPVPWLAGAAEPEGTHVVDTLFADVSEFQRPVTDAYTDAGYRWLSIRSNDGTYQDHNFYDNYAWCVRAVEDGRLDGFIVYFYWRPNWSDTVRTHIGMVQNAGGPHPKMVTMIDVESGGNPGGDQSDGINRSYWAAADWLGDKRRVIGYANTPDFNDMWPVRPEGLRVIAAGYGSLPNLPGQIAHQYTDGQGYGGGLPEGAPPFGNCDMNSANGYSPADLAVALGISNTGGFMSGLNDAEQRELLEGVRYVRDQLGPKHPDWPADSSLGQNAKGEELTLRDGVAELKRTVEGK